MYGKEFFANSSYGKSKQQKLMDSPKAQNLIGILVHPQQKQHKKPEVVSRTLLSAQKSNKMLKKATLEVQASLLQGRVIKHSKTMKSNLLYE